MNNVLKMCVVISITSHVKEKFWEKFPHETCQNMSESVSRKWSKYSQSHHGSCGKRKLSSVESEKTVTFKAKHKILVRRMMRDTLLQRWYPASTSGLFRVYFLCFYTWKKNAVGCYLVADSHCKRKFKKGSFSMYRNNSVKRFTWI